MWETKNWLADKSIVNECDLQRISRQKISVGHGGRRRLSFHILQNTDTGNGRCHAGCINSRCRRRWKVILCDLDHKLFQQLYRPSPFCNSHNDNTWYSPPLPAVCMSKLMFMRRAVSCSRRRLCMPALIAMATRVVSVLQSAKWRYVQNGLWN